MPQLDVVTFFSQFFWLSVIYLGFYLLVLKYFLPKMGRILKFRKKKINFSQQDVTTVRDERHDVGTTLESLVARAVNSCKTIFQENLKGINLWLDKLIYETNHKKWKAYNQVYVFCLGEKSLSQNIPLNLTFINVSQQVLTFLLADIVKRYPTFSGEKDIKN